MNTFQGARKGKDTRAQQFTTASLRREERLKNNTEFARRILLERYGRYPEDHPSYAFLHSLLEKINGKKKTELILTRDWTDENAAALPDGAIFYSSKLLRFLEFLEEHEFVLRHEYEHISDEHAERISRENDDGRPLWKRIIGQSGAARVAEYEADIRALVRADEEEVNPYGAMVATQRFIDLQGEEKSDIIHGSPLIRLLNMQYVARLVDMPLLTRDLTPVPPEVIEGLSKEKEWSVTMMGNNHSEYMEVHGQRKRDASRCGIHSAMLDIGIVHESVVQTREFHWGELSLDTRTGIDCDTEILKILCRRIESSVDDMFYELSAEDRRKILALVLELGSGCRILDCAEKIRPHQEKIDPLGMGDVMLAIARDPGELSRLLSILEREKDSFFFHGNPSKFLENIVGIQKKYDKGVEVSLVKARGSLRRICESRGLEELDLSAGDRALARYMLGGVGSKEGLKLFAALCDSISLCTNQRQHIFDSITEKFGLSTDEALELGGDPYFAGKIKRVDLNGCIKRVAKVLVDEELCPFNKGPNGVLTTGRPKFDGDKMDKALQRFCRKIYEESSAEDLEDLIGILQGLAKQLQADRGQFFGFKTDVVVDESVKRTLSSTFVFKINEILLTQAKGMPWDEKDRLEVFVSGANNLAIDTTHYDYKDWSVDEIDHAAELLVEDEVKGNVVLRYVLTKLKEETFGRDQFFASLKRLARHAKAVRGCVAASEVYELFERVKYDLDNPEQLDQFLDATVFIPDIDMRIRAQKHALRRMLEVLPKDKAKALLFDDERTAGLEHLDIKEEFIDKVLEDPREIDKLYKNILGQFVPSEAVHERAGELLLVECGIDEVVGNKAKYLKLLLSTVDGDMDLVKPLYRISRNEELDLFELEFGLDRLYNLDAPARYSLVQNLLVGEGGALLDPSGRRDLLEWFFEKYVEAPTDEENRIVHATMKEALVSIAEKADVATVYFLVAPLITERILLKPENPVSIRSLMENDENMEDDEKNCTLELWSSRIRENIRSGRKFLIGQLGEEEMRRESTVMKPVTFVKEAASKLGAPGVRFLQNLGMYVDVPDSLAEEFNEVYDSIAGQNKLSAFHTLKRQWGGVFDDGVAFGERVGGGSMFTVFEGEIDNNKEAIKIVNPNALFHAQQTCGVLKEVLESNPRFAIAATLIDDIKQWLEEDLSFAGSKELEARFHASNDGWRAESNSYSIFVPEAVINESGRFRREEFVEGLNLTRARELVETGHDIKAIVSLIVQNSVSQLEEGLMHPDIHPGNIRVREDKRVALLDRGYYIVLDEKDREFVSSIPELIHERKELADAISNYLSNLDENAGIQKEEVASNIAEALGRGNGTAAGMITAIMVALRRCGCKMPLKLTLTLKNAIALEKMSRMAGFDNVLEAYLYNEKAGAS